jgi:heme/copper-type cytochrome/quinol oxidase subunit 1
MSDYNGSLCSLLTILFLIIALFILIILSIIYTLNQIIQSIKYIKTKTHLLKITVLYWTALLINTLAILQFTRIQILFYYSISYSLISVCYQLLIYYQKKNT